MARKIAFVTEVLARQGITKMYLPANSIATLQRPKEQVDAGFNAYLRLHDFAKHQLKITLAGDFEKLPTKFKAKYKALEASSDKALEASSAANYDFELVLLLNWSLVDEVVRITNHLQANGQRITKQSLLAASDIPEDIDLIIRTGKRQRLSSFIPLSAQYAELYFMDILFPDITAEDIHKALDHYKNIATTRTFGK